MAEKFCLEWNDSHSNWRQSLLELRTDNDFADVTLVTEDKVKFKAHKILLSSCSDTLKFLLKDNIHSNPLLYLSGINSENLGLILEYIYCGEVKLFHEQLDCFLENAKKLEIKGLVGVNENKTDSDGKTNGGPVESEQCIEPKIEEQEVNMESKGPQWITKYHQVFNGNNLVTPFNAQSMSKEEVEIKRKKLYQRTDEAWICNACDYNTKDASNMRKHVEKHIVGLSWACKFCNKTFKSKSVLYNHMRRDQCMHFNEI